MGAVIIEGRSGYRPLRLYNWALAFVMLSFGFIFPFAIWSSFPYFKPIVGVLMCVSFMLGGVCFGVWYILFARAGAYYVVIPGLVVGDHTATIVADPGHDPLLPLVMVRLGWAFMSFGLFFMLVDDPIAEARGGDSLVEAAVALVCGLCMLCWALRLWVRRTRRRRYPGDIELSAQGIRQRVENRVTEAAWESLGAGLGVARNDRGEVIGTWLAVSSRKVTSVASQVPWSYQEGRPQQCKLLLTPVGKVFNFNTLLRAAQKDPQWASRLFDSPDRLKGVHRLLTARDPVLEITGSPTPMLARHDDMYSDYDPQNLLAGFQGPLRHV